MRTLSSFFCVGLLFSTALVAADPRTPVGGRLTKTSQITDRRSTSRAKSLEPCA
jgi:hypothetical protein